MWQDHAADPFGVARDLRNHLGASLPSTAQQLTSTTTRIEGPTSGRGRGIQDGQAIQYTVGDRPCASSTTTSDGTSATGPRLGPSGVPTLVVTPYSEYDLQRERVDLLRAFATKLRDGQSSQPRG